MAAGSSGGGSLQSPAAAAAVPHPETGARAGRFEKMRGWGTGCSTGGCCTGLWERKAKNGWVSERQRHYGGSGRGGTGWDG